MNLSDNVALLFSAKSKVFSSRAAIWFNSEFQISYSELEELSNKAAFFLLSHGVKKGDTLALCINKSISAYVMPIAALKVGAPYFFIDTNNPLARVSDIINQCNPKIFFHHHSYAFPKNINCIVCPENIQRLTFLDGYDGSMPPQEADEIIGTDPAYIMFTSGSTGLPKGAVISHSNLMNFINWTISNFGFTTEDVHTQINPLYFDNSIFDYYSTIFTGGSIVPFESDLLNNPRALIYRLKESRCTVWFSVPSLLIILQAMKAVTRVNFLTVGRIIFGGEGYPKIKLKEMFDELSEGTRFYNVYGPTECTCICSSYEISNEDFNDLTGLPALGYLNANFSYMLLDQNDRPSDSLGELCLIGNCVGLGYFRQEDVTKEKFIQNPSQQSYREIVYRSGDIVKVDATSKKLYFIGRVDSQIKHLGYRIEAGEVEAAIILFDEVIESVVFQRFIDGFSQLIAIVSTQNKYLNKLDLRNHLALQLPSYMIPSKIYIIPKMPKNANGKTDRRYLIEECFLEESSK